MARESKQARNEKRFGKPERFADAIPVAEWRLPVWFAGATISQKEAAHINGLRVDLADQVERATHVDATSVAEFFYATNSKEEWKFQDDFPCCAPPMKTMFFEAAKPSCVNSEGVIKQIFGGLDRFGWIVHSTGRDEIIRGAGGSEQFEALNNQYKMLYPRVDVADLTRRASEARASRRFEDFANSMSAIERTMMGILLQMKAIHEGRASESVPDDLQWNIGGFLLWMVRGEVMPMASFSLNLNKDGRLIDASPAVGLFGGTHLKNNDLVMRYTECMRTMLFPLMLAMSFMNCKNTTLETHEPDKKLNRARAAAGLKPFVRYHTINIEPMRKVLKTEGGIETNGLKKALHICRGHFARYSEDKPLFGHTSGLVWRPAHTRGAINQGVVISDYKVNAPKTGV